MCLGFVSEFAAGKRPWPSKWVWVERTAGPQGPGPSSSVRVNWADFPSWGFGLCKTLLPLWLFTLMWSPRSGSHMRTHSAFMWFKSRGRLSLHWELVFYDSCVLWAHLDTQFLVILKSMLSVLGSLWHSRSRVGDDVCVCIRIYICTHFLLEDLNTVKFILLLLCFVHVNIMFYVASFQCLTIHLLVS